MTSAEPADDEGEHTFAQVAHIPAALASHGVEFIAIGGWLVQAQRLDGNSNRGST